MFCQKRISWNQNLRIILILGKEKKDQVNPVSNKMKWKECSKEFCFFEKVLLQLFFKFVPGHSRQVAAFAVFSLTQA